MRNFKNENKEELINTQNINYLQKLYDNLNIYDLIQKRKVNFENGVH